MPRRGSGIALFAAALAGATSLEAGELDLLGVVSARGLVVEGQTSWLEGGFGRLTEGGGGAYDAMPAFRGQLHLGLDWRPSETWLLHAHGVVEGEPSSYGGRRGGLVEAFLQFRPELTPSDALRFRAGLFFPPTSLESTEPLWQSPYTVTLSALNSWIGEEVRLAGLETAWIRRGEGSRFELAGTVFGLNDPSGALLAWRGWGLGDRLTTAAEVLPLPPLSTLVPGSAFGDQRADGTRPVDELDARVGYALRARFSRGEGVRLQAAWTANLGDRRLHEQQYSWDTRFAQAGLQAKLGGQLTLLAEGALGDTGMGPAAPGGPHVDVRFRVGYALLSWNRGAFRVTARIDAFENEDRDGTAEPNQESGWAFTGAFFWRPLEALRAGVEYLVVRADRPAAAFSGGDPLTDARRVLLELRFTF